MYLIVNKSHNKQVKTASKRKINTYLQLFIKLENGRQRLCGEYIVKFKFVFY